MSTHAWTGRDDGPGPEHRRWHQQVQVLAEPVEATTAEPVEATPTVAEPVEALPTVAEPVEATTVDSVEATLRQAQGTPIEATPTVAEPVEATTAEPVEATPTVADSVALVGFACDAGVARNKGRIGAAQAPAALRAALGPLAVHQPLPLHDLGDVTVTGDELEAGQEQMGALVTRALDSHGLVVVLGGGHETAWASYLGRTASSRLDGLRVGVLNLDAHFDLREAERPSSGTPFRQMAMADQAAGRDFRYMVAGISRAANTPVLFQTAEELGVEVVLDVDCQPRHLDRLLEAVDAFRAQVDVVHLSIDLDLLPAAVAPGVSAPAGYGVPMEVVDAVVAHVAASGQLVMVDVVELCPPLDVDNRTARAAARLVHTAVEHWVPAAGTTD